MVVGKEGKGGMVDVVEVRILLPEEVAAVTIVEFVGEAELNARLVAV